MMPNPNKTPEYATWERMKARCYMPNHNSYKNYGGRGIVVCDAWRNSFASFLSDMGKRPSENHSLDRINNDGNYEPGNCKWSTAKDQARNRRNSLLVEIDGQRKTLAEWCEIYGTSHNRTRDRIVDLGWPPLMALTTPPLPVNCKKGHGRKRVAGAKFTRNRKKASR